MPHSSSVPTKPSDAVVRVAVDAMGGDFAPREPVLGAIQAVRESAGTLEVVLVGREPEIRAVLAEVQDVPPGVSVVHTPDAVPDGGHPAHYMRAHPDNSLAVAAGLAADGEAQAALSVGHTGGSLIAASWKMGLLPGIERPTAGVRFPFSPDMVFLDVGLNPEPRAPQLFQFGVLGAAHARIMMDIAEPTVALLSNGSEKGKGTDRLREAYRLFEHSPLHFVGYVEGFDLIACRANVVVSDGFTGNVVIKFLEGLSSWAIDRLEEAVDASSDARLAPLLGDLDRMTDVTQTSDGIAALGVGGIFVPGHGRSRAPAIANLIAGAATMARRHFAERVRQELLEASEQPRVGA